MDFVFGAWDDRWTTNQGMLFYIFYSKISLNREVEQNLKLEGINITLNPLPIMIWLVKKKTSELI